MSFCSKCHKKRQRNEPFKKWVDYNTHKEYLFCNNCWLRAKKMRQRGFTFRSGLKKGPAHKVGKLRWQTIRKFEQKQRVILKKQIGKCELCGSVNDLQVHHYRPKKLGGEDKNINYIVLCKECHKGYHEVQTNEMAESPQSIPGQD